jgi:hypothetical protein
MRRAISKGNPVLHAVKLSTQNLTDNQNLQALPNIINWYDTSSSFGRSRTNDLDTDTTTSLHGRFDIGETTLYVSTDYIYLNALVWITGGCESIWKSRRRRLRPDVRLCDSE